jgi:hypothetical protein
VYLAFSVTGEKPVYSLRIAHVVGLVLAFASLPGGGLLWHMMQSYVLLYVCTTAAMVDLDALLNQQAGQSLLFCTIATSLVIAYFGALITFTVVRYVV